MSVAGVRDFGMIVRCLKEAKPAGWRMHTGSPAFGPWRRCKASLVTRMRGSCAAHHPCAAGKTDIPRRQIFSNHEARIGANIKFDNGMRPAPSLGHASPPFRGEVYPQVYPAEIPLFSSISKCLI